MSMSWARNLQSQASPEYIRILYLIVALAGDKVQEGVLLHTANYKKLDQAAGDTA